MGAVNTGVSARAELWNGSTKSADLALTSLQVTADMSATVRRQVRFTAAGVSSIAPTTVLTGTAATYGTGTYGGGTYGDSVRTELRGLLLPSVTDVKAFYTENGTETGLGTFMASQVVWTHDATGFGVACTAYGVSRRIQRTGWDRPFVVGGTGQTVADGIRAVITDRCPSATVTITGATDALPTTVLGAGTTSDPWADVVQLAMLSGCVIFDDATGGVTVMPVPDLSTMTRADAAWTFADGVNGTVMRFADTQDDADLINTVVVLGASHTNGQYRAVAQITDPASPWNVAAIGEVTKEVSDSAFTSLAQCQVAANAILRNEGGLIQAIEVDVLRNPAVHEGDLVWITSSELGTDGLYVVRSVSFDPAPNQPMTVTAVRTVGL